MIARHCLLLLLPPLLWPFLAGPAAAQDDPEELKRSQSHLPIPSSVGSPEEAQLFLSQRLHHAEGLAGLQKLLEDPKLRDMAKDMARNPDKYHLGKEVEKLKKELADPSKAAKPDLNDPAWRDLIDKVMQQQAQGGGPDLHITPDQQQAWRELLERFPQESHPDAGPGGMSRLPEAAPPQPGGSSSQPSPTQSSDNGGLQPLRPSERSQAPPAPAPDPRLDTQARFSKQLYDLAERLRKADPNLQDSPALVDFMKKLSRYTTPKARSAPGVPDSAKHLGDRLPRLGEYLNLDRLRRDAEGWRPSSPLLPTPPHLPHVQGPPMVLPGGLARPGMGPVENPGWPLLLWALVGVGFGIALWRALAWQQHRTARAADGWKLGPWPVDPAAVATREDLVRAFDYLALLCLGPTARSWNHLEIAARLGDEARRAAPAEERRGAAARLALLYEQARYAPPGEPVPAADLAAARRHLCLLAGVPAA